MATYILIPELDGDDIYIIVEKINTVKPLNSAGTRSVISLDNGEKINVEATTIQIMTAAGFLP